MSWERPDPPRDEDRTDWDGCPPHEWQTDNRRADLCVKCGISFRDWARGFGSNVRPKRVVR